jgi:hypothetical protein
MLGFLKENCECPKILIPTVSMSKFGVFIINIGKIVFIVEKDSINLGKKIFFKSMSTVFVKTFKLS